MIAQDEELPGRDLPGVGLRIGRHSRLVLIEVGLVELRPVDEDEAIVDVDRVAGDADDPLDEWRARRIAGLKTTMSPR